MRLPFFLNPHRSRTLPAVSFFEGFQTPAGLEKTRAHLCGRHLKPISKAAVPDFSRSHARQGSFGILIVWTGGVLQEENVSGLSVKRLGCSCHHGYERAFDLISRKASNSHRRLSVFRDPPLLLSASTVISALASAKGDQGTCVTFTSVRQRSRRR